MTNTKLIDRKINIGKRIREARLSANYKTQQDLADALSDMLIKSDPNNKGISLQSVSLWETGTTLPSIDNLILLADCLGVSVGSLVDDHGDFIFNTTTNIYDYQNMAKRIKTLSSTLHLTNTLKALEFATMAHGNVNRNNSTIPYIYHPLNMACHLLAMDVVDDTILAATLLHDVVEDTKYNIDDLPVNDEVKQIVALLTKTDKDLKKYYNDIKASPKASLIKLVDRCNNLTTMSWGLSYTKKIKYIKETEELVLPLLDTIKNTEYDNQKWLLSYQIKSMLDIYKRLIQGES